MTILMPAQRTAVEVTSVTVSYGPVTAVRSASLRAEPGEVLAVTGHSGAGKSSLLWAVAGAAELVAGSVAVGGTPVAGRESAVRAGVTLIPQGNGLAAMLTAYENILVPLLAAGIPSGEADRRSREVLEAVGLGESWRHLVEELSGGQQQRVAVARGLAMDAPVLLADEPTSELDHDNRERVLALLRAQATRGAAVVMATHDPEAAALCDHEVHLDDGVLERLR